MPIGASIWGPIAVSAIASAYAAHKASTDASSTPTLPANAQGLQDQITALYMNRLKNGSLPPGYQQTGIAGINQAYAGAQTNENAQLTARGLASSPVAGAVTSKLQTARAGAIGSFNANLPLVQQNLELENLQGAEGALTGQRGQTGSSTTSTGGGVGGALDAAGGMAGYIAQLRRQNAFANPPDSSFTSTTTGNLDY